MKKTIKQGMAVLSIAAMLGMQMTTGVLAEEVPVNAGGVPLVFEGNCSYQTQIQNVGWQDWKSKESLSGTTGKSLRLEGIKLQISDIKNLGVSYQTHVQNEGWQDWVTDGAVSGTEGESLRLEAIRIKLTGTEASNYDIYYQVHVENTGWMNWVKNGELSGTEGKSYRLEGIKVVVLPKGSPAPFAVAANDNVPTLDVMTKGALNVLDNDEDGFFLMVEGGAIDWAGHGNSSGRVIEEEIDFNHAVEAVCDWFETNSNWSETLVIVTGDHETGYLTGTAGVYDEVVNNGKGVLPTMVWNSKDHTNQLVPFFAKGTGAELLKSYADGSDPLKGAYLDNSEIALAIRNLIN